MARELCASHKTHYNENYGEERDAIVVSEDQCERCQWAENQHATGCICADCSGAELTSDND